MACREGEVGFYDLVHPCYTIFHKETEITFSEYLTACRINRAKELLLQTDEKVKEIGRQAGYRDNRHFCKMFKRVTGMTPQEYRKLNV